MKKIKEVIQEEVSDCGICCLLSIIKYYGGYIPLETLRINTNTNEYGTTAYELVNYSKKIGFNSYGEKKNKIDSINYPVIVHLKLENNFYHYVVIYKIDKESVFIMDPSVGKKKIKKDEFYHLFTGVILYFIPINKIPYYKKNNIINKKLKDNIKNNKQKYILILFLSFLILIFTLIIGFEINILNKNLNYLYLLIIFIIVSEILSIIKNNMILKITTNFNLNFISEFVIHLFKLPLYYLKLKPKGEIVTRFNEINTISREFISNFLDIIYKVILISFIIILLLILNIKITLMILFILSIFCFYNIRIFKSIINEIRYSINLEESYNSNIIDYISNIETIINLNSFDYFIKNINNNLIKKNDLNININKKILRINLVNNILLNSLILIILYLFLKNNISFSTSMTLFILTNYIILELKSLIEYYPTYSLLKSMIKKNNDFLSVTLHEKNKIIKKFKDININKLSYEINNNKILKNINLVIKNKDKILISGPSGIGKSTLLKILSKEINTYEGSVRLDNIDLNNLNTKKLISYTSQNDSLFDDTILKNITLDKKINEKYLNNIIKICRINNINSVKKMGLNASLINNSNLSGGERNRIILARSLVNSKNIIILDEVLKEVDYKLEVDIIKDMLNYFKNKTIIYVSHKDVNFLFNEALVLGKE